MPRLFHVEISTTHVDESLLGLKTRDMEEEQRRCWLRRRMFVSVAVFACTDKGKHASHLSPTPCRHHTTKERKRGSL
jgi:hypothetical protein